MKGRSTILASSYIDCPICTRPVNADARVCPFCGADIIWVLEERRITRRWLVYLAVSLVGGVFLGMAFLTTFGLLA